MRAFLLIVNVSRTASGETYRFRHVDQFPGIPRGISLVQIIRNLQHTTLRRPSATSRIIVEKNWHVPKVFFVVLHTNVVQRLHFGVGFAAWKMFVARNRSRHAYSQIRTADLSFDRTKSVARSIGCLQDAGNGRESSAISISNSTTRQRSYNANYKML